MSVDPVKLIKKNPFVLAPMDDVTDLAFRQLCEKYGSSYSTTELTSVEALIRDKVHPSRYIKGNLKVNSVQLFGSKPESFVLAAKKVSDEADIIDVNFGCPSACVTGNNAGSMLLKDPKNVGKIIEKLVKEIDRPITAKIRLGYEKTNYKDVAKEIEDAGAELIAVHGRTAKQKYTGKANWGSIAEVHELLSIPVIGNGDIASEDDIDEKLGKKCSALMVGRSAIGNPLIFKRFNHYYKTGKRLEVKDPKAEQKKIFMEYLKLMDDYEQFRKDVKIQRQAAWFMKGIDGAKKLRMELQGVRDVDEVIEKVKNF